MLNLLRHAVELIGTAFLFTINSFGINISNTRNEWATDLMTKRSGGSSVEMEML